MKLPKLLVAMILGLSAPTLMAFPKTVSSFDLPRYLGKWYEVASTKPGFQRDCACVTADYGLKDNGRVSVINTCRAGGPDGPLTSIEGEARKSFLPARLKVSFGTPTFFSNYYVVDLAEDYSWAAVSGTFKNPIWILSRTPSLDDETTAGIMNRLAAKGYRTDRISPTQQEGCPGTQSIAEIAAADGRFNTLVAALQATGLDEVVAGDGAFTVLAPTDDAFAALGNETIGALLEQPEVLSNILLYHVVAGTAADSSIVASLDTIEMANGGTTRVELTDGGITINGAKVIIADIKASNGIIHVIDQVLLP